MNKIFIIFLLSQGTTVLPSRLNQSNFFDILLPLAKWNMIICLLRTFLENALKKQNFPFSPLSLHCACMSVGNSVFFFFKLAAPMTVLFFKVARSPFKQKYGITHITTIFELSFYPPYFFPIPSSQSYPFHLSKVLFLRLK